MSSDPFERLKERLEKEKWPRLYMFKFIVPPEKLEEVKALFGPAKMTYRESRNGNYISITGKEVMLNAERVIDRYRKAAKIEGCISL